MFEAADTQRTRAPAEAVWELWADPVRWAELDERIERAETEGELAVGSVVKVKMRKGGTSHYDVVELEPGRALVTETRFPGARFGHERRVARSGDGAEISHRLYVRGPLWVGWALMLSRKRMRASVELFADRERQIVEPGAPRRPRKRRRR